ncbi:MAG: hypothetical protein JSR45_00075 [Proteobacteria bacterium]|nr:hypothetical protein [Pseudomonadota bacterium]
MAIFPKIQSPCPFKNDLAAVMDGDMCRLCKRQVHDLTAMSDDQRLAFMADCTEEVCVSYRLPARVAVAAAMAAAAAAVPMAAAAQQAGAPQEITEVVVAGGIKDLSKVKYVKVADEGPQTGAELPVVYEEKTPSPAPAQPPAKDAKPVTKPAS